MIEQKRPADYKSDMRLRLLLMLVLALALFAALSYPL